MSLASLYVEGWEPLPGRFGADPLALDMATRADRSTIEYRMPVGHDIRAATPPHLPYEADG